MAKTFKPTLNPPTKSGKNLNNKLKKELTKQSAMNQVQKPNIKIKENKDDFAMSQSGYNDLGIGKTKTNRKKDIDPSFQNFKHLTYESLDYVDESDNISLRPIKRDINKKLITKKELIESTLKEAKKKTKGNPWAICSNKIDKKENPEKFEKCVKEVKKQYGIKENHLKENRDISWAGDELVLYAENDYDTYKFVENNRDKRDIFEFALSRYEKEIKPLEYDDKETLFYEFANGYDIPEEYQESIEETTTSSSSGSYVTPHMWAPNKKGWANAKKRWWGENSPNTGGNISKGGIVNVKDKCRGYQDGQKQGTCNSGDISNITLTEDVKKIINKLSLEYNKPVEYIKNLIKEDYCNKKID